MARVSILMFFLLAFTAAMRLGSVVALMLLMPTFLVLYAWAEQLEAPLLDSVTAAHLEPVLD